MKLSAPKRFTFWLSVALAVLGVLAKLGIVAVVAPYGFWLVVAGFVLLMLGNLVKGF